MQVLSPKNMKPMCVSSQSHVISHPTSTCHTYHSWNPYNISSFSSIGPYHLHLDLHSFLWNTWCNGNARFQEERYFMVDGHSSQPSPNCNLLKFNLLDLDAKITIQLLKTTNMNKEFNVVFILFLHFYFSTWKFIIHIVQTQHNTPPI